MQIALPLPSQRFQSQRSFLSHLIIIKAKAFLPSDNLPIVSSKGSFLMHKRLSTTSIFSRKRKKRSGSRRFTRFVLKLIPIVASNLKAPPRPLHLIAEELGCGNGNGGGSGLWGGSGWGWFDGWRRGGRRKIGFLWVILAACGWSLVLVGEMEGLAVCRILGLGLLGLVFWMEGWNKKAATTAVKNGVLGICLVSFLGLRKEEVRQKRSWVQGLALVRQRRRPGKFWQLSENFLYKMDRLRKQSDFHPSFFGKK